MMPLVRNGKIVVKNNTLAIPPEDMELCIGLDCSGDPSMRVTVTGATPGSITWCGELWVLPGDSGVEKCVCPTTYLKNKNSITGSSPSKFGAHKWLYFSGGIDLLVSRYYRNYSNETGSGTTSNNQARVLGTSDRKRWRTGVTSISTFPIGLISGVGTPTYSDYDITDDFFGEHTISGITYKWEKGNDW